MNSKCQYYSYATGSLFSKTCFLFSQCTTVKTCEKFQSGKLDCIEPPKPTSTSTSTTTSTVSPLTKVPQCSKYMILDDPTRHKTHEGYPKYKYTDHNQPCKGFKKGDWKGVGWYRISGAAGTKIPDTDPGKWKCGTWNSGYVTGGH